MMAANTPTQGTQMANATRFDGGIVKSDDGRFEWERCMAEYVSISCSKTGLSDNTHGQVGNHVVHMQYAEESAQELMAHPDGRQLIEDARDFRAVARTL